MSKGKQHSIREMSAVSGVARDTLTTRAKRWGIFEKDRSYSVQDFFTLKPLDQSSETNGETLEDARRRQANADADVKELTAGKLRRDLVEVDLVLEAQNNLFDKIGARIKTDANLTDDAKEDLLGALSEIVDSWK